MPLQLHMIYILIKTSFFGRKTLVSAESASNLHLAYLHDSKQVCLTDNLFVCMCVCVCVCQCMTVSMQVNVYKSCVFDFVYTYMYVYLSIHYS